MTNQQLKAHCEDVIANPQDHLDWVVDMARVALKSLEAVPVAWVLKDTHEDTIQLGRNKKIADLFSVFDGHEVTPLYTAPPMPELKLQEPINWKEAHSLLDVNQCGEDRFEAFRMGASWQLDEIKRLNGVKS